MALRHHDPKLVFSHNHNRPWHHHNSLLAYLSRLVKRRLHTSTLHLKKEKRLQTRRTFQVALIIKMVFLIIPNNLRRNPVFFKQASTAKTQQRQKKGKIEFRLYGDNAIPVKVASMPFVVSSASIYQSNPAISSFTSKPL